MALLLNRKYGSRLECLYYILQSCYNKFNVDTEFALKDFKYDNDDEYNVHQYCQQLKNILGRTCCPFLKNPLNNSKCYATQSINSDSTKLKAASDVGGSLEALGFIRKVGKKYLVTEKGKRWAESDFNSEQWSKLALEGVLSYGVVVGFLFKIKDLPDVFSYSGIYLSYPKTEESVAYTDLNGNTAYINLSTDSTNDSNTRTMSRVIGWCVAVGLLEPICDNKENSELPHIKYREFLNKSELGIRNFKKTKTYKQFMDQKHCVDNPLSYKRLHKNVGSLRERGGEELRNITLEYNQKILNRRFVFVYVLNKCSEMNTKLNFEKLVEAMEQERDCFFAAESNAMKIMETEAEIADIAGIPFLIDKNDLIVPVTTIKEEILLEEATTQVIELATTIWNKVRG